MKLILTFFIGVILWPLVEYSLHRFLGHVLKVNTLFRKEHTRHHAETNYFAPLGFKLVAAIPICGILIFLGGLTFASGFIVMFSFYEWFHWSIHALAPSTKLGMKLRKHHLAHHFHHPKLNHGVTTVIMDKIFGTYKEEKLIRVPKNIPLPWLFLPGSQTVDPRFQDDFQLR